MKIRSFKAKLIFSYVFVVLVSLGCIAFFIDRRLEDNSFRNLQTSLITQARLIENQIPAESLARENIASLEALTKDLSSRTHCRITVISPHGNVLGDSDKRGEDIPRMENHLNRPEVRTALAGDIGIDTRYSSTLRINMLYVALPIKNKAGVEGVLRLALPLESVERTLFEVRKTVIIGLLFALFFAVVIGYMVASAVVKPIRRMIQVSKKYSEGDFTRRILRSSDDEIGDLAETLNGMAQQIEDKIREIRNQNQKFSAVFNSMIEGVIVADKDGRILSVNPAVERAFGVLKKDVEGRIFLEAIRNKDMAELIAQTLRKGEPVLQEVNLLYPEKRIFEANATPIYDNHVIIGCLVVVHDITEMRRLETVRKDFVANVSHELKTPLTSIKGFVETLLAGAVDDKEHNRDFLKIVQEHAGRLESLVNDLLTLSYLESRETRVEKTDYDLAQQLQEVIPGFMSQIKKKHIDIRLELPAGLRLHADKAKVQQVLINLIDNAIKFNKENGTIRIYAEKSDSGTKVCIEDTGIGIPPKDIPRIFERFYRVDKARSREMGGTGLGLSIVKHIVELHGGSVTVESGEGLGSTFCFSLPPA
jgi:two-component system phosphate regulon sensor histidine kinase PhoR